MATFQEFVTRAPQISATHRGPIVNLVGWILMVIMILSVATVLISKIIVLRKLTWWDSLVTVAMVCVSRNQATVSPMSLIFLQVFGIGFTVAISEQVNSGLGSRRALLSQQRYISFQKAGYASQILYICAATFAKLSTTALLRTLSPQMSHRYPIIAVASSVLLWAHVTIITSAFQCTLPAAYLYSSSKCINQIAFWKGVGVVDIALDLAIMALPIMIVAKLQLSRAKKIAVVFAFSFRALTVGCTVFRLTELSSGFDRSIDLTLSSWRLTVATELCVFFAIFATCVPHLRPFLNSIEAGYLTGRIDESEEPRSGFGSHSEGNSHGRQRKEKLAKGELHHNDNTKLSVISYVRGRRNSHLVESPRRGRKLGDVVTREAVPARGNNDIMTTVRAGQWNGPTISEHGNLQENDERLSDGSGGSNTMIIKATQEWSVTYHE